MPLRCKVELQADCFAGAWAKREFEQGFLESGDFDEAMNAANQIGDDRLTGGRIPSSQFTHGTSEQRMHWFRRGYEGAIRRAAIRARRSRSFVE